MRLSNRTVDQYVKQVELSTCAQTDRHITDELIQRYRKQVSNRPSQWRIIMQNRTIRYATSAIVLSLGALIIHSLGGSPDGTTLTFAQVLDQIRQIRPYAVTSTIRYQHTDKSLTRRVLVLNALQRREEFPDGLIRIFDHSKQPVGMLQLNPSTKQALWQVYPDRDVKAINSDIVNMTVEI